jgi:four helix bundle protein
MGLPPRSHRDLDVYKRALQALVIVMRMVRAFPADERFDLCAQMRASSRSVCSAIAEAWRKRNYPAAFASKLTESESEAAETQTWADVALVSGYVTEPEAKAVIEIYDVILGQLVRLRLSAPKWKKQ